VRGRRARPRAGYCERAGAPARALARAGAAPGRARTRLLARHAEEAVVPRRGAARAARAPVRRGARGLRRPVRRGREGRAAPARARGCRDPVLQSCHRDRRAAVRLSDRAPRGSRRARAGPCGLGRRRRHHVAARARVPRVDRRRARSGVAMKRLLPALALLVPLAAIAPAGRAGLIAPPPAIVAMWDGKDGASVRATLLGIAALGEPPGASARQKLESGEAAWWLGVQDEHAGRADSALAQWRRAVAMRGDFDEGFALIDALSRNGSKAALAEAYGLAASYADQARLGMPSRLAEAQARLAWVRHLRGHPD